MNLEDFKEKFMNKKYSKWNFDLFKIRCVKCNSEKIEFNGHIEIGYGYYSGEEYLKGNMVVKCHSCGNAMVMKEDARLFNREIVFNREGDNTNKED